MSLSGSRVGYRHRCTIERDAKAGGSDSWGQSDAPEWKEHLADIPCSAWTGGGNEPVDDDKTAVQEQRRVSLPLGTDVTERDRVASVTLRGATMFEGPMDIQAVLTYSDHLELVLERIR